MSEFGRAVAEKEIQSHGLPERFDHRGLWYDSPSADLQVGFVRDRIDSQRTPPTVYDAIDVLRCEIGDIKEQKKVFIGDRSKFSPAERELDKVQDTLLEIASGEAEDIHDKEKDRVTNYLDRQEKRWEIISNDTSKDPAAREAAKGNQKLFASLQESLFSSDATLDASDYINNGSAKAEKFANTHEIADGELQRKENTLFPEYKYQPDKTIEVLATLREKDTISFDDINEFYDAATEDIKSQLEAIKDTDDTKTDHENLYAGWKDAKTAVDLARGFYAGHQNDKGLAEKHILVSLEPNGKMHAGFELTSKNPEGTKHYSFSLKGDASDLDYFGKYAKNVDDFENRLEAMDKVKKTLAMIQDGSWKLESIDDLVATMSVIDRHKKFLAGDDAAPLQGYFSGSKDLSADDQRDFDTLGRFTKVIKENAGLAREE